MIITLKRLLEWLLLFVFFFLLVIVFYYLIIILNQWIGTVENKEPIGGAVKVISMGTNDLVSHYDVIQRLKLFYLTGE